MGREIGVSHFKKQDFEAYRRRLAVETDLLGRWLEEGRFSRREAAAGFELEAWLVDRDGLPAPLNEPFLKRIDDPLIGAELSRFNIELNGNPHPLRGGVLSDLHENLSTLWSRCRASAEMLGTRLAMIGILPTLDDRVLTLDNMSRMTRYRALNEQVLRMRRGRPLVLDIQGRDHLHTEHCDVMLEAATTSFQLHLQVRAEDAARYYNAAVALAAPLVAACANSPLLFGRRLWAETRIPLFEQAVSVGGFDGAAFGPVRRVTFGSGYARHTLFELFRENQEHYPPLLPVDLGGPPEALGHLLLHNGTIWRWVRPLVGFDDDGTPHFRIEQRVLPAGPSIVDSVANAALFFGAVHALAQQGTGDDALPSFSEARDNFYTAARRGLKATAVWSGVKVALPNLLHERLLPMAREGLEALGCDRGSVDDYLALLERRIASRRTGAQWQLDWLDVHGGDMRGLVNAYLEHQEGGCPVHEWPEG